MNRRIRRHNPPDTQHTQFGSSSGSTRGPIKPQLGSNNQWILHNASGHRLYARTGPVSRLATTGHRRSNQDHASSRIARRMSTIRRWK